jgi:hypothetical protein
MNAEKWGEVFSVAPLSRKRKKGSGNGNKMSDRLANTCCARLPSTAHAHLGALRACEHLSALQEGETLWLFWPAGEVELARAILSVEGSELFLRGESGWHRLGEHLPVFHVPHSRNARPLSALLFPAPVSPVCPAAPAWRSVTSALVRDGTQRPASVLSVTGAVLRKWADVATSHQLRKVEAACCGEEVLLRGALPVLPGERFWGRRVLLPLGYRVEPDLAEGVLLAALGLWEGEVAFWTAWGVEVVGAEAFGPVTRAGVRLSSMEVRP